MDVHEQRPRPVPAEALPTAAFRTGRKVRFSDCDPAGMVYTPRFFDLMNGVIEDFYPARLNLDYHRLLRDGRIGLGYVSVNGDFFKPGLMGDDLVFALLVEHVGGASARFVIHGHRVQEQIVRGRFVMVTTSLDSHRAITLPEPLRAALTAYQEDCR